jgi:hypothetical protein
MTETGGIIDKAKRIVMSAIINLASHYVIEESTKDLIRLIEAAEPDDIWKMVESDYRLINAINEEWKKKIDKLIGIVKIKKLEREALELIDRISADVIIEYIARNGSSKAVENILFISSSPRCYRWLCNNIEDFKQYFRSRLS